VVPPKDGFARHLVARTVLLVLHHEAHGQSSQSYYLVDARYWSHHTWDDHSTHVDQLSLSLSHTHTHTHTHKFAAPSNQIQALRLIFQSFKYGTHFTAKSAMGLEDQAGSTDQNNISIIKVSWSSRLESTWSCPISFFFTFCCFHKSPPF
jgi:hypothetical protein